MFASPASVVWFRHAWPVGRSKRRITLQFRAVGTVSLKVAGRTVYHHRGGDEIHTCMLPTGLHGEVRLTIATTGEPPALRFATGMFSTATGWECSHDGFHFQSPSAFPASLSGLPPHRSEEPVVELAPISTADGIADFGRELLGRVVVPGWRRGTLTVGESPTEVRHLARNDHEQHLGLVATSTGAVSAAELALRWVHVTGTAPKRLRVQARFHPVRYRGAFACSDRQLNDIWMRSAYTLRLCMQDVLVDGLKRDRMPWVGDLALSVLANAYTFADHAIVQRTLVALYGAGARDCHLNGIVDYTLWWPIALGLQRHLSGDPTAVVAHQAHLRRLLEDLTRRCNADGLLPAAEGDWVFIDWVDMRKDGLVTAVQVLWHWALRSIAELIDDPLLARQARQHASRVTRGLVKAWTPDGFRMLVDHDSPSCRHATLLAVMCGILPRSGRPAARRLLSGNHTPAVGTPYMGAFQAAALARLGDVPTAVAQIRTTWGGMLGLGATSFWEAYDPAHSGDQHWSFYGRPFGKSLCHAWGSGPAALLPEIILGVRPLASGWSRFSVNPQLGDLSWACACIPTPFGDIEVEATAGKAIKVRAPSGTTAVYAS